MLSGISRGSAVVLLCAMGATGAQADVTAQEVWSDWQAYLIGTGYELSSREQMSGDTLTVSDTILTMNLPDDGVTVTVVLGELTFTENADGTVNIAIPETMPITIAGFTDETVTPYEAVLNYTQSNFAMLASGQPDDLTYVYSVSSMGLSLVDVQLDGVDMADDFARFDMSMGQITGSTRVSGTDVRNYSQTMQASDLRFDLDLNNAENGGRLIWSGGSESLQVEGMTGLPANTDTQNMAAMIDAGFNADFAMDLGPGSSEMTFEDTEQSFAYQSSSDGGTFAVQAGPGGFGYALKQNSVSMNMAGSEVPLPISLSFAELVFDVLIPVMQSDTPQDFDLRIGLGDFVMSDLIWGIFDPTGQLPRDPATIRLALNGQARLLADILDPMVAIQLENGPPPAELEALKLDALEVSAAGASLTGMGDFTFDNTDTTTFEGLPRPTGFVDLQLVGGNGLLDKLVAMGLLPQEQAGGARMMMGLFAVPGSAPDTLNSRIEINDQGHILANGQRIQ